MTVLAAVAAAALLVALLVLWQARSMLQAAKDVRHEADRNLASMVARHDMERDKLLDRIALYDGKPAPQVVPLGETPDDEYAGLTANVESLLADISPEGD